MKCAGCNHDALPEIFMEKVEFTDSCWLWKAAKVPQGYGMFTINKKKYRAHRYSWIIFNGEIPKGMSVCHKCDIPECVNPDHLFLGTHQENMDDMVNKGRSARGERTRAYTHPELVLRGERIGSSKLTQLQVDEIRMTYRRGTHLKCEFSTVGLAKKYGVSKTQINNIVSNRLWVQKESV